MTTLVQRITDLATRVATEAKALRTLINGNSADLSSLTTTAKGNLVLAINELKAAIASSAGAGINDAAPGAATTYSSQKIEDLQLATRNAILGAGVPSALDTLDELANALGDDANFASTITTALGNRLRFDAAQALTAPQKAQGNANLGSAALADTGTLDTDFVSTFNTGLA